MKPGPFAPIDLRTLKSMALPNVKVAEIKTIAMETPPCIMDGPVSLTLGMGGYIFETPRLVINAVQESEAR